MQPLRYEAIDVAPAALDRAFETLRKQRGAGNVTLPHKEAAYRICDQSSREAARAEAVNTFWTDADGQLIGANTDVGGFDNTARDMLGDALDGARIALLGAGGAARAVLTAVERWPGAHVALWNRDGARAERIAARFDVVRRVHADARDAAREATVVINATSIGLLDDAVPVSLDDVPRDAVVLDLVYRPGGTAWVREAIARGMRASDGLPMLLEQGALAFEAWFNIAAPRDVMRDAVR